VALEEVLEKAPSNWYLEAQEEGLWASSRPSCDDAKLGIYFCSSSIADLSAILRRSPLLARKRIELSRAGDVNLRPIADFESKPI
jgi:hypothetical protein